MYVYQAPHLLQIVIEIKERAMFLGRGVRIQRTAGCRQHPCERVSRARTARAQKGQARPGRSVLTNTFLHKDICKETTIM